MTDADYERIVEYVQRHALPSGRIRLIQDGIGVPLIIDGDLRPGDVRLSEVMTIGPGPTISLSPTDFDDLLVRVDRRAEVS